MREHLPQTAHPPSLDTVCEALGLASRGSLHKHVQALIAAGLVAPMHGQRRGLVLTEAGRAGDAGGSGVQRERPGLRLRLLGRVAAGRPIEAVETGEEIEVGADWATRADHYALTVRGDSMIDEGIHDGDTVIVEHRSHARNGEIVIALIDGAEATVKRIEQKSGAIVLHPANSALSPLVFGPERVTIRGVVKGLIRRYG